MTNLSAGIGSVIAFFSKTDNRKFLSLSLGFSAGVMIYVSMVEIFVKAKDALSLGFGEKTGTLITIIGFFGGMLLIGLIDRLIPGEQNPHEVKDPAQIGADSTTGAGKTKLMRTGLFTALAIAIHNFPEGLATFVSALQEPSIAIPIVVAIAIHCPLTRFAGQKIILYICIMEWKGENKCHKRGRVTRASQETGRER